MARSKRDGQRPRVASRPVSLLVALPEGIALTALAVLPAFVNLASERIFEEEKALLLRAGAALALPGTIWAWRRHGAGVWRQPIIITFVALMFVFVATALAGVVPLEAFTGAYIRRHGIASWGALATMFAIMCLLAQTAEGRERLGAAIVIGSVWPAVYALLQAAGIDPIEWTSTVPERSSSTFGNPILLGGYLAVVIPLTAMQAYRSRGYVVFLVLQLAALAASGSRGPMLAVGAGALVSLVVVAWTRVPRRVLVPTVLLVGTLATVMAAIPAARPAAIGRLLDARSGSGRVRVLIWRGVIELTRASGARLWIGHGPESLPRVFPPYYSPEIGRIDGTRDAIPDRAHNELLDTLVSAGIPGAMIELAFFVAVITAALRVPDPTVRAGLVAACVAHVLEIQLGIATVASRLMFFCVVAIVVGIIRRTPESVAAGRAVGAVTVPWASLTLAASIGALSLGFSLLASRITASVDSGTVDELVAYLRSVSLVTPLLYGTVLAAAIALSRKIAGTVSLLAASWWRVAFVIAGLLATIPLAITPSRADVLSKTAVGFESRQQWQEAVVTYREAARMQPGRAYYLTGLSRALIQAAAPLEGPEHETYLQAAREALRQAQALDPLNADHVRNLASLYRVEARTLKEDARDSPLGEADRLYGVATSRSPNMPALWIEWANVKAERRRFSEALQMLDRAIALDESRFDAWLLRGHVHMLQRNATEALTAYERALSQKPQDVGALRGRAMALAALMRQTEALESLDQVLALTPGDAASLRLRAQLAIPRLSNDQDSGR